jgi:hypothetical protein
MAIQVNGCTVIDDGRNLVNVNDIRVGLVTITGSTGDIETPGTITAAGVDFSLDTLSFFPANGETNVGVINLDIFVNFNQAVKKATTGIGTTANITFRNGSAVGTAITTINVSSNLVEVLGAAVKIKQLPGNVLPNNANIFVVIDADAFESVGVTTFKSRIVDTYSFTTKSLIPLGDPYEGGFLICKSSPTRWVVAPNTSEVSRTWSCINDANTTAQSVSGCTGWFVPTRPQLQNPGYTCRDFWDSFSLTAYWSSTEDTNVRGCIVNLYNGCPAGCILKGDTHCVRAFRCVTY